MIREMFRQKEPDAVHLKDYDEAMHEYRDNRNPVWGAWTEQEQVPRTNRQIPHWVMTSRTLTEPEARQAVKVAVEQKTGQLVRMENIHWDP